MGDELYSPESIALTREAAIASQSISAGLTSLRKANYAATGLYSHAFFSVTIGLERLLKIIFLLDVAIQTGGAYPTDQDLRTRFGHDIRKLFSFAREIHARLPNEGSRFPLNPGGLEDDIIEFFSKFAVSSRYYNLNFLTGRINKTQQVDPIAEWYKKIGSRILMLHYSEAQRQRNIQSAIIIEHMLGSFTAVLHTTEEGSPLTDVKSASLRTGENKIIQKYGTFYCAKIVRFYI